HVARVLKDGRELKLAPATAAAWAALSATAGRDGVTLLLISGFRSVEHQRQIVERKLAEGKSLAEILRVNAAPGYSEHHTGRAVDIGTPGCPPLTEAFEETAAFAWLARRAAGFGFRLSYPRDNPHGVIYEPWHWFQVG
ncbi:MAG TPA: M15 family metallopeptidase, partial [Candidatus Limnocylindria bacterium]|nr:M15 family metallopeptidase [Candidatus Limnocylindria bacterium]